MVCVANMEQPPCQMICVPQAGQPLAPGATGFFPMQAPQQQPQQQAVQAYVSKEMAPMVQPPPAVPAGCGEPYVLVFAVPVPSAPTCGGDAMGVPMPMQVQTAPAMSSAPEAYGACWPQEGTYVVENVPPPPPVMTPPEQGHMQEPALGSWGSENMYSASSDQPWMQGGQWCNETDGAAASDDHSDHALPQEQQQPAAPWGARRGPGSALQRRRRRQRAAHQPQQQHQERRHHERPAPRPSAAADASLSAELTAELNHGGEALMQAVATLREPGVVRRLSFEPAGCRAVQLALDVADRRTAAELAAGLRGRVAEAIRSPHANYVLQKIIKVLTPQETPFVVEEVSEASLDLARHEYGCRIYCRLLEHAAADERTARLIDEVLLETDELVRHTFGHHVVECALEHGLPHQRQRIIQTLRKNLLRNAWNRNAAYVVEKALLYGSQEDRQALASDLLSHSSSDVAALARSQFGSMVVRALLRLPGPIAQRVQDHLRSATAQAQLKATKHGRRLLDDHGLSGGRHAASAA